MIWVLMLFGMALAVIAMPARKGSIAARMANVPEPPAVPTTLWVTLRNVEGEQAEILGVFDGELRAVAACRDEACGIGPMPLNMALPDERQEWPGFYYPHLKARAQA